MVARKRLRLAPLWWACAVGLTVYVVAECLVPAKMVPDIHVNDKLEHAGAFGLMTILYAGVLQRRRFPLLIVGMLLLGAGIEMAQGAMGLGRDMDFWDWVADAVGVVAGATLAYLGLDAWMLYIEQRLGLS
jgi:VanZ family protein